MRAYKVGILLPRIIKISAMYTHLRASAIFRRNNYFADNNAAYLTFVNRKDFITHPVVLHMLYYVTFLFSNGKFANDAFCDSVTTAIIGSVK